MNDNEKQAAGEWLIQFLTLSSVITIEEALTPFPCPINLNNSPNITKK